MKTKFLAFFFALAMANIVPFTTYGDESVINGVTWYYTVENGEATITEVENAASELEIPAELGGCPVVALGANAVAYDYDGTITSVTLPNSLKTIGSGNFYQCCSLSTITFGTGIETVDLGSDFNNVTFGGGTILDEIIVPEDNAHFSASGGVLYNKDRTTLLLYADKGTTFDVPSSVTAIGRYAFCRRDYVTELNLNEGLKEIRDDAFCYASGLESITLPNGLELLGYEAFRGCTKPTSVTIPSSLSKIGDYAFNYCDGLEDVTISEGVTEIGANAFLSCRNIAAIIIPDSVTVIASGAFTGCESLSDVTIGSGVTQIGDPFTEGDGLPISGAAFGGCDSLMNFKLAEGNDMFEEIGGCLFLRHTPDAAKTLAVYPSGREDLYFPDGVNVERIGESACSECHKFTEITIPASVRYIDKGSFVGCSGLTKLVVPEGVNTIGRGAFGVDYNLMDVEIAGTVQTIEPLAFVHTFMSGGPGMQSRKGRLVLHEGIVEIGDRAFARNRYLTEVVVPDSASLGEAVFAEDWGLVKVTLGSGVEEIPDSLFYGDDMLKQVTIKGEITSVGTDACFGCASLVRIDLGDGLTSIGDSAFSGCESIRQVIVPASIEIVGEGAFGYCTALEKAYLPKKLEGEIDLEDVFVKCGLSEEDIIFYEGDGPELVTVTFKSQDEKIGECSYVSNILDYLPRPSMAKMAFIGWFTEDEGGVKVSDANVSEDTTFYARWAESPFDDSGEWVPADDVEFPNGEVWYSGDVAPGAESTATLKVTAPAVVRFDWKFAGDSSEWGTSFSVSLDGEEIESNIDSSWSGYSLDMLGDGEHEVSWTYNRSQWSWTEGGGWLANIVAEPGEPKTVTFEANGGIMDGETKRVVLSVLGELPVPVKAGQAFAGWYTYQGERVHSGTEPFEDVTYYAHWVVPPFVQDEKASWFVDDDGSWRTGAIKPGESTSVSMEVEGPFSLSFDWRCETDWYGSFTFRVDGSSWKTINQYQTGWQTVEWSCSEGAHTLEWVFTWSQWGDESNVSCGWLRNIRGGTPYEITFDNGYTETVVTRSGTLGALPLPYRFDYVTFDGWYTDENGGTKVDSNTPVTGEATYYAHWVESPVATFWGDLWLFQEDGSLKSSDGYIVSLNEDNPSVAEKELRHGPGTLTFKWRMRSDSGRGAFEFLVDGDPDYVVTNTLTSTSDGWIEESYVFDEEYRSVRWAYTISGNYEYSGVENGWIKDIVWTPNGGEEPPTPEPEEPTVAVDDSKMEEPVENVDGTRTIAAKDGETLTQSDVESITITATIPGEASPVDTTAGYEKTLVGNEIVITLKTPEMDTTVQEANKEEGDSTGMLADVEKVELSTEVPTPSEEDVANGNTDVAALPVKSVRGLYYQASWGSSLEGMTEGQKVQATGSTLNLGVIKQKGSCGFYKLSVSEK